MSLKVAPNDRSQSHTRVPIRLLMVYGHVFTVFEIKRDICGGNFSYLPYIYI